ncbi:hypothetical protein H4R33_000668 [Dimargaris cristalligena]|uniref:Cytidine deaminase-like protein n=1 Tax=Dimargaris cristalligena TaxID=215637 RepID=A0A4Q0A2L1_9FUNG|nr:hypothetical protein H4R33_000668 [Dimargaris cristalligena]RKP40324.1 cytidine deaminase-like protein [Dimargaris cristalligena]|eukprot:RKP40324.1 cytidine deaminase-like protein [Dimargaris cristalligena]
MATPYTPRDIEFLKLAIAEAHKSVPVESAYCVGAVLVSGGDDKEPRVLATGFSRELPGNTHAEECALQKAGDTATRSNNSTPQFPGATMYTTMEPCSRRLSGNVPCCQRLIEARVARVVLGVKEPPNFVQCEGLSLLEKGGIEVVYIPGYEKECLAPNAHIISQ